MGNDDTKIRSGEKVTEEQPPTRSEKVEINLGEYFALLRKNGWKIVLFSLAVGLVTLLVMYLLPDIYQASAVIAPPVQGKRENPAFGMLATLGVNVGGATKVEDLESLFKSNDLTVRVFGKHNLWPSLYKDRYDPATGKIRKSWTSRLFDGKEPSTPRRLGRHPCRERPIEGTRQPQGGDPFRFLRIFFTIGVGRYREILPR